MRKVALALTTLLFLLCSDRFSEANFFCWDARLVPGGCETAVLKHEIILKFNFRFVEAIEP